MELEAPISASLAAVLLYAIESDLAGAAGKPGELDNIALSSLTLIADTLRYIDDEAYVLSLWNVNAVYGKRRDLNWAPPPDVVMPIFSSLERTGCGVPLGATTMIQVSALTWG